MISAAETIIAHLALENVLAQVCDEQEQKSITEAVRNTITGTPVASTEGETDADTISNS